MFTLSSAPSLDCDDDDGQVSAGFYSAQDFESVDQLNFDLDASSLQYNVTDPFIDTKNLTSNHILSPPGNFSSESSGESFVQHAQEQFDMGETLKFTNCVKAKQHFSLAALYFHRAGEGVDTTVSKVFQQLNLSSICYEHMHQSIP